MTGQEHKLRDTEHTNLLNRLMNTGKVNHRCDSCYSKYNCKCIAKYKSNQHIQILIDTFQDFSGYQTYDQCKCTNYQMIP